MSPVERRTLAQQVYEALRDDIRADRLPPGMELSEGALAESLGVSRGPVREALRWLGADGLVVVRPRRGAVVASLSKREFLEAYQVREALEVHAARLAVPRMSADDVAAAERLIELQRELVQVDDVDGFFKLNEEFHGLLVAASGNTRLIDLHTQVISTMERYRKRSLVLRGNMADSVEEHAAIIEAARSGDVETTARLISEHVGVPQRRIASMSEEEFAEQTRLAVAMDPSVLAITGGDVVEGLEDR